MIRFALLLALGLPQDVRFVAYDVVVDSTQPLAVWQVELTASGNAKLVGIAGGDAGAYANTPYHDPAALQGGRIVLGAYTTETAPKGRVRVAQIQVMETGKAEWTSRLVAAAAPGGARIEAKLELVRTGGK